MKKPLVFSLILIVLLASCSPADPESVPASETPDGSRANLPNPASDYCKEQGYTVEIRTADGGSQSGFCIFPNGGECDEWAYYCGECEPANQVGSAASPTAFPIYRCLDK